MADIDHEAQSDLTQRMVWDSASLEPLDTGQHALVFSIAERNFAIAADYIEQIVELPRIVDVPLSGASLLGLADHGGKPVPVVNISPLLRLVSVGVEVFRHGLLLSHQGLRVMLAIEAVVVLRKLSSEFGGAPPAAYRTAGFADYICDLAIGDHATKRSAELDSGTDTDQNNPSASNTSDKSGEEVVVLNVPKMLTALQVTATQRMTG